MQTKTKLFSTSILISLAGTLINITNVNAAPTHTGSYTGNPVINDYNANIEANNATDLIFKGTVNTKDYAAIIGIYAHNASEINFEGSVNTNGNNSGIYVQGSTMTFEGAVNADGNGWDGIYLTHKGSSITFAEDVTANKNSSGTGINANAYTTMTFSKAVTANYNWAGISNSGSSISFNGPVTANYNDTEGFLFGDLSNTGTSMECDGAVTANYNKGDGLYSTWGISATFNNDVTASNNELNGIYSTRNSFLTFNNAVTLNNNKQHGMWVNSGSTIIFNHAVTATGNTETGIYAQNSTITYNGDVTVQKLQVDGQQEEGQATKVITFGDGSKDIKVSVPIISNDGSAIVRFNASLGGLTITEPAGTSNAPLNEVKFSSLDNDNNKKIKLGANVYSSNIAITNTTFAPIMDITLTSTDTSLKEPIFDLESNTLNFAGAVVHPDANGAVTFNTTYDGTKIGKLVQQSGTFDMATNINNVTINLTEGAAALFPKVGEIRSFDIFSANGGAITFADDGKVTLNPTLNATNAPHSGLLQWAYSQGKLENRIKENLADGITVDLQLDALAAGTGELEFLGSAVINKAIGTTTHLNKVSFTSGDPSKIVNLNADVKANELYFGEATYRPTNNITLTSVSNATTHWNSSTFDLGLTKLIFSGPIVHDDATKPVTINTVFDGINGGHIELAPGNISSMDLTNASQLIINLTDAPGTKLPIVGETRTLDLFIENDNQLKLKSADDTTINAITAANEVNLFVDWTFDPVTGILSGVRKETAEEALAEAVNNPNTGNLTPETTEDILNIASNQGTGAAIEAIERLTNSDAVAIATTPVNLAVQDATQVVSNRAETISQPLQFIVPISVSSNDDSRISGVAAGDTVAKYGAWVNPFYGISAQKSRNGQPGYKSSYYGGIFGVDSLINDKTAIGIAFGYIKTDIKHKDLNNGDRTKSDSFIVSGYGIYEITKEWFAQAVATFGHSKIKNREIRTEFGVTNIAAADYNAISWGGEILTGYNQKIRQNLMLTPLFGLEFNRTNGIHYKESGTNTQNLIIKAKSMNQLEAIAGARISAVHTMGITQKNVTFLPEIHGNVRYGLLNKKLSIDIRQDGAAGPSLVPRTAKQGRLVYNAGGSITAKYNDQWEYKIGYDVRLADKYIAHQGTLKLRLNF